MEINRRKVYFPEGITVHRAAELNGIYIPSLCSHKDLSPFGGCRLCVVEIEGMRGYPLSCNTTALEGMKVSTETPTLLELRREFLKLILSEHPSSCLICGEKTSCQEYQGTIRKTGITTGCRFCPNDGQCELQDLVDKIGVTDIDYPILYHGYEPEHDDPFYDRDYNLCILCGRCVRMCHEVRGTNVLAFTHRGPQAKVGPAFGRNHREAGCEFCGACVDVCPVGALMERSVRWTTAPDRTVTTICPYCGVGCQLNLEIKDEKIIRVVPDEKGPANKGQACVKGKFGLDFVNSPERLTSPLIKQKNGEFIEASWGEAFDLITSKLANYKGNKFVAISSAKCTNEDNYVFQKFTRGVMGTNNIDHCARL